MEKHYSIGEEVANGITHGLGAVLGIAGLAVLATFAALHGRASHVVSCSVFGATLVLAYTSSTLYHSIQFPAAKRVLRALDHSAIYLLIAGTYTPITLVSLGGTWGWTMFGIIWGLAVLGIVFELTVPCRLRSFSVALYVAMGWAAVAAIRPLLAGMAPGGLILLLAGGLAYTGGIVFYLMRRLPYHHAVWHLFVLAGSIFHFFCILFYVIPR